MNKAYKLVSLFDGSGGFPLAGSMCGIIPVGASEVEPYPIAVTKSRFPGMKHLGDITKINGAEIESVDIVTFGSPCQGLSQAGLQKGLADERSGLFMEAVRIIKEMREATNGRYPTYAVWENVPGAFSSNGGEDFRTVLEELIRIAEPSAVMPDVPKGGWAYADWYMGDGWSIAYRVLDAQHWGVPQRRRRIYLVLNLGGERAGKILFEREGVRGYFETGRTPWQGTAADAQRCAGADDRAGEKNAVGINGDIAGTLDASYYKGCGMRQGVERDVVAFSFDARGNGDGAVCNTITGDHENRVTDYTSVVVEPCPIHDQATRFSGKRDEKSDGKGNGLGIGEPGDPMNTLTSGDRHAVVYALDRGTFNQGINAQYDFEITDSAVNSTLVAKGPSAVCYDIGEARLRTPSEYIEQSPTITARCGTGGNNVPAVVQATPRYIVRRLTPTECARLQGFPDEWGHPTPKDNFTDEEYKFWRDVRNTHAEINGKATKDYTKQQMLTWYNKLHTDSAEYKMWGNGIALPTALYVMQGIAEELEEQNDG